MIFDLWVPIKQKIGTPKKENVLFLVLFNQWVITYVSFKTDGLSIALFWLKKVRDVILWKAFEKPISYLIRKWEPSTCNFFALYVCFVCLFFFGIPNYSIFLCSDRQTDIRNIWLENPIFQVEWVWIWYTTSWK